MKKLIFILILNLSLFVGKAEAQCVTVGLSQTICQESPTSGLGGSLSGGATTALWTDGGVSGVFSNPNDLNSTWTPPAGYNGTAVLTLTATDGGVCIGTFANVQIVVSPSVIADVSVAADGNPVCSGTLVTFTATATNGGTTPSYQWYKGAAPVGTNSATYTDATLSTGDVISVRMTSSLTCVSGSPATSTGITMTVNANLPAGVSITADPAGSICTGTSVAFSATATNGGTTPSYQWYKGAAPVGTNSATYTDATLSSGDIISVRMTSSLTCVSGSPATSTGITMTVNTNLPAGVSITADPAGSICTGTSVAFSATATNGGTTPSYQWYKGAAPVGTNSATYTDATLSSGDVISVRMTSSLTCVSGSPATSTGITMTVNANLPASVSIAADPAGPICTGTSVAFSATATNGGTTPSYQWYKGAAPVGTNSATYTDATLSSGDIISVRMTSSLTCVSGSPATSSGIAVTVTPTVGTPDIPTPSSSTICRGSSNTVYTTFATNATSYTWSVTGAGNHISGSGTTGTVNWSPSFSGVATVSVTATGCGTSIPSGTTVTVIPTVGNPSTPTPSSTTICQGSENTTYMTSAANATSYNWNVTGTGNTISGTGTTATVTWAPGFTGSATISVTATGCGTSPPASTTVSVNPALTAGISGGTTPVCYDTSPGTLTASGSGGNGSYTYLWYKDGLSTGVTTQNYNPGHLTTTSSFYCSVTSGACGTVSTSDRNIVVYPELTAGISGGISPICSNTSPGTFTANGSGGTGSYTYLWYKDLVSTGVTSQTYNPGPLAASASFYCAMTSGSCGTVSTPATTIIVSPQPTADISYSGSPWCNITGTHTVTLSGTPGGTYSAQPSGLSINSSTGTITTETSTPGTYTVIYTLPPFGGCGLTTATASVTILLSPSAPVIGTVTQTTCSSATGSVVLSGLPLSGWIVTRTPGGTTTAGSGPNTTITGLPAGSYSFTVSNSAGCNSPSSTGIVINPQPASPSTPVQNIDCSLGYGNGLVEVISPVGVGFMYSIDGGIYQSSPTFNLVNNGGHIISVTNSAGCTTIGLIFTVTCGCINPPDVALSSNSGTICSTTQLTVAGNTFGGSATNVILTTNGAGILSPVSENISPFAFTYTPVADDAGKTVTITVTTNNPVGGLCNPAIATYALTVNAMPEAPIIGTITNLTCTVPSGSVMLSGLPPTGTWTLTRNPGGITSTGSGSGTTVSGLTSGSYSFTVTSEQGCTSTPSANAEINPQPSAPPAPVAGNIIHPTCATSTGSAVIEGLPSTGAWTLTRSPGGVTISGSGTVATVASLPSGIYTFTVTNSAGCTSAPSGNVVINAQPPVPAAPSAGTITAPTCILSTGGVSFTNLPSTGTWTLIRYPGTVVTTGAGTTTTITGLSTGTYNFTVTTANGCLSVPSANVIIPVQPAIPAFPIVGTITQPTFSVPYGSVLLNGLPSSGAWTVSRLPGAVTTTGTGGSVTITNLAGGVYTFVVTNSTGCTSAESAPVTISTPGIPVLLITDPPAVCAPLTVDITSSGITAGSTPGLIYTYWNDSKATISYATPKAATAGTYYIKGTTVSGYFNIKPVIVTIDQLPVANAGADQVLDYQFNTTLDGSLEGNQTGIWSQITGTGELSIDTDPKTPVNGLSSGDNVFVWTIKSGVCPAVSDTVSILVQNLVIPTLITPNMDGRNDFFVLKGLTTLGKTELRIFDRRGVQLYINMDYDNTWDGVDFNDKPLPDDTYFYIIKARNHKPLSGYIVIRR